MKKNTLFAVLVLSAITVSSCRKKVDPKVDPIKKDPTKVEDPAKPTVSLTTPEGGITLPYTVLKTITNPTDANKVEIRNGGFGSAAVAHPTNYGEFYALTDRGANTKIAGGKIFPTPDYTPRIGHFKLVDGKVTMIKEILFKDPSGKNISGRPNPVGKGSTGETPYNLDKVVISTDDYGLDSEGLVALKDGGFWVSDEYGPHIVHFDSDGKQLERISPVGVYTGTRKLPAVFARRWANRGMEGLAITPDEKTLVGIMQSTLYNPAKADVKNFTLTRIVTFEIATGKTKQFLYKQDKAKNSNSEITAISATEFLVIERDKGFLGKDNDVQKKIYKIDISGATDVSVTDITDVDGKKINAKTLEQSTWAEIEAAGIKAVKKTEVADLVKLVNYPHDKMEGIWLIDNHTLGILNDDDFGVWTGDNNKVITKKLYNAEKSIDANTLYIIKY